MRSALLAVGMSVAALLVEPPLAGAATAAAPTFTDHAGIHVVSAAPAGARVWKLAVTTKALAGHTVDIDVLLPDGYDARAARRYPVLYLFHGTSGRASDWLTQGDAERTTSGLSLITVMPDAGFDGNGGGWFTNWVDRATSLGASQWETFDVDQLIPFIDHNLRTLAARPGRAVAGLSQGGYGAFSLAARHPDLFLTAGSFSGAPDIGTNPVVEAGGRAIIDATEVGLGGGVEPDAAFGSPLTHEINFQGHNPGTLVRNLRPVGLYLWTGNGQPGPYDSGPDPTQLGGVAIEAAAHASTLSFADVARRAGVAYHLDDYGPGTHSFPYWARDLRQFVGPLMRAFAHPSAPPAKVSYTSVERRWTQWGWTVANHRVAAQAWGTLSNADARGFDLTGTGSATLVTPPGYRAGSRHRVTVRSGDGTTSIEVRASSHGRLTVQVPLVASSPTRVGID